MEAALFTAAGKLIMILLCLCGMSPDKDPLRIDVISKKGVVESLVVKPTADGFTLWEQEGVKKLMDIRRDGSATSFVVSENKRRIDLTKVFPDGDFKDFSSVSQVELKDSEGGDFKVTRSGGAFYVTGPSGVTFSIHR